MPEPEVREELVMTRIGGGRSAIGLAVAFVVLLAGGWLVLVLGGGRQQPAASPSPSAAILGAPPTATAPPPAATAAPVASPSEPPTVVKPLIERLLVNFTTGERRYEIPLLMNEPGMFEGVTTLTYPLGLGGLVELVQVSNVGGTTRTTPAGSWQAVFYSTGAADRDVPILEYAQPAQSALRELPGVLRHGYRLVMTADGGHYAQLTVQLTSPYGLRLSRPGACEGGWRFAHAEERC